MRLILSFSRIYREKKSEPKQLPGCDKTAYLAFPEGFINAYFPSSEFLVRALLNDLPVRNDENPVHLHNRREAMCNDDDGLVLHKRGKRLLDQVLGFGIQT